MENISENMVKNLDKRGILNTQQIKENESSENMYVLIKEIQRLTIENYELKAELDLLHNGTNNNSIEAEEVTESFLTGNCEGYDIDELARAYGEIDMDRISNWLDLRDRF